MTARLLAAAFALALVSPVSAQSLPDWAKPSERPATAPPPSALETTPPGPPATPSAVPIDGGLGLLALAGGAYALRRLRD